jgi:CO/xanthine dehydrogenase Mo-binding subunit
MIVAESRYVAEDALADVIVDIDPIDAVNDLEAAMKPSAPLVHPHLTSNLAAHVVQRKGDYAKARAPRTSSSSAGFCTTAAWRLRWRTAPSRWTGIRAPKR